MQAAVNNGQRGGMSLAGAILALKQSMEARITSEMGQMAARVDAVEAAQAQEPEELQRIRDLFEQRLILMASEFESRLVEIEGRIAGIEGRLAEASKRVVKRIERDKDGNMSRIVEE